MKKYYYELYCELGQILDDGSDNFSIFVETNKKIRTYGKLNCSRVLKTQEKLEKLLKEHIGRYHIVGIKKYDSKDDLIGDGDLDDKDIIKLDL